MSRFTPKTLIFLAYRLDKGHRSNITMWKNFPTPKVYKYQKWLQFAGRIFKGYDNVAMVVAVENLNLKTISPLFKGHLVILRNYYSVDKIFLLLCI